VPLTSSHHAQECHLGDFILVSVGCASDSRAAGTSAAAASVFRSQDLMQSDEPIHYEPAGDGIGGFGQQRVKFCFTTEWVCRRKSWQGEMREECQEKRHQLPNSCFCFKVE
jgi:hypothetical protein